MRFSKERIKELEPVLTAEEVRYLTKNASTKTVEIENREYYTEVLNTLSDNVQDVGTCHYIYKLSHNKFIVPVLFYSEQQAENFIEAINVQPE